jgi:hypothetical protein
MKVSCQKAWLRAADSDYTAVKARLPIAASTIATTAVGSQTTAHTAQHSAFSIELLLARLLPRIECALWCAVRCGWSCLFPPPLTVPGDLLTLPAEPLQCCSNPPLVGSPDPRHLDVERVSGYKADGGLVDLP